MSKNKEVVDLNRNPRSVDNFLAKFVDSKYNHHLNTSIGNGESVNDYGMQICKQLNIDTGDLLDKTIE